MPLVRPTADIASFPAPGWTTAPLFSDVNDVEPNDATFIVAPVLDTEDPQVALALGDLEIPFGASGRIECRVRMRWSAALTVAPAAVRIGLADAADLGIDNPTLLFERSLVGADIFGFTGDTQLEFQEFEVAFNYEDFAGDAAAFGIYVEMTPDPADVTQVGHISDVEVLSCVPAVLVEQCSLGSLTVGDIITRARDHHPSFEDRAHPNGVLLRMLSNYQRDITAKIARVNPGLCASEIAVPLPLADFNAGVKLPSYSYVLPAFELRSRAATDLKEPIDLVDLSLRSVAELPRKFVYLKGNHLFLGRRPGNYDPFDQLHLQLVLTPKNLETLNDPLILPDYGVDTYAGHLAMRMAVRGEIGGPALALAASTEVEFLTTVAQQKTATVSQTLDVFPWGF